MPLGLSSLPAVWGRAEVLPAAQCMGQLACLEEFFEIKPPQRDCVQHMATTVQQHAAM